MYHWEVQLGRELGGLIEPAGPSTPCMQRHRYHAVRVGEDRPAALTHRDAQTNGEGMSPVIFQEMDDLSECSVVGSDRTGTRDR